METKSPAITKQNTTDNNNGFVRYLHMFSLYIKNINIVMLGMCWNVLRTMLLMNSDYVVVVGVSDFRHNAVG